MKRETIVNLLVFLLLVAIGVMTRWISDIYQGTLSNFTATSAAALFAGYYFRQHLAALLVPLSILVVGNLWLDNYNNFWEMGTVYVAMLLPVPLGWLLKRHYTAFRLFGFAAAPAVLFFLATNCVYFPGLDLYPKTISGQTTSYLAAIPFGYKMLAGDLIFTGLLFGVYHMALGTGLLPRPAAQAPASAE